MLLVTSIRLLSEKNPVQHISLAQVKLEEFVNRSSSLYGSFFVTLNVHNLIHITSNVERTGLNLNKLSAFPFESYLGEITSLIRLPIHVVAQYCKRLLEKKRYSNKICKKYKDFDIISQSKKETLKVSYQEATIRIKHPNNTVLLRNSNIVEIKKFLYVENILHIEIQHQKVIKCKNYHPCYYNQKYKCVNFRINVSKLKKKWCFPYTLVEFVTRGRTRKQWIEFNKTRQRGTTKFLTTIENEEDNRLLHDIVKNLSNPLESWTSDSVNILGDAASYEKAIQNISRLEVELRAFSLDSGEELEDRQSKILEEVKRQKLLKQSAALDDILAPPSKNVDSDNGNKPKSTFLNNDKKSTSMSTVKGPVDQDNVPTHLNQKISDNEPNNSPILSSEQHKKDSHKNFGASKNTNNGTAVFSSQLQNKNSSKSALMNRKKGPYVLNL
ncbi:hypothetical protein TSAR_004077 [Trichomalopsis sarcophagae]|uniref:Uncharacterized protein n=1 Tax=Trichomalopsis sarcophagae TaxID=543379 RepID=A0A232EMP9_9HYME|nr:hypothetical protein TSAR_004077 [Trichomalopsis sarcophagae]